MIPNLRPDQISSVQNKSADSISVVKLSNYTRVTSTTTTIVTQPVVRVPRNATTNTTPSPMTGGEIISLTLYFTTGCQEMGNSQHGSQAPAGGTSGIF